MNTAFYSERVVIDEKDSPLSLYLLSWFLLRDVHTGVTTVFASFVQCEHNAVADLVILSPCVS